MLVLEGRDRVGGKVLTFADVPGLPEAGGQWIGSGYGRVVDAAERSGSCSSTCCRSRCAIVTSRWCSTAGRAAGRLARLAAQSVPEPLRELMPWQYVPMAVAKANPARSRSRTGSRRRTRPTTFRCMRFLARRVPIEALIDLAYDTNASYGTSAHDVSSLMMAFVGLGRAQRNLNPGGLQGQGRQPAHPRGDCAAVSRSRCGWEPRPPRSPATDAGVTVTCADGGTPHREGRDLRPAVLDRAPAALRPDRSRACRPRPSRPAPAGLVAQVALVSAAGPSGWTTACRPQCGADGPLGRVFAIHRGAERRGGEPSRRRPTATRPAILDRLGRRGGRALRDRRDSRRTRPAAQGPARVAAQHSWSLDPYAAGDWACVRPGHGHAVPAGDVPAARASALLRRADRASQTAAWKARWSRASSPRSRSRSAMPVGGRRRDDST